MWMRKEPGQRADGRAKAMPDRGRPGRAHSYEVHLCRACRAQPLGARDKVIIGLKDAYSVMNFGGMFAASGYEQLRNGEPHYGSDRGAFGERLGAAGIRDTAQGVLTDGVYAPLLHQDHAVLRGGTAVWHDSIERCMRLRGR